ncbi:hypothetical protein NVP1161O_077 [Vibrio phage 1.161.O._10N.261.48.C5]|nr:hypothetical protein NVP1161O_077 [Vibrio phage 1.161.O._10N.261.48.C5]
MKALKGKLARLLLSYVEGRDALRYIIRSGEDTVTVTLPNGKTYIITNKNPNNP